MGGNDRKILGQRNYAIIAISVLRERELDEKC
jgi:hypothetical protein